MNKMGYKLHFMILNNRDAGDQSKYCKTFITIGYGLCYIESLHLCKNHNIIVITSELPGIQML